MINILQNTCKRHPIVRPWGQGVHSVVYVPPSSLYWCFQYCITIESTMITLNRIHQQCSLFSGGPVRNHQSVPRTGYKIVFRQWKINENQYIISTFTHKSYDANICHVNIIKPIIFQLFVHLTSFVVYILIKFYCFASRFVPNLEAKSMVPKLTTRDSEHCWWSLLHLLLQNSLLNSSQYQQER